MTQGATTQVLGFVSFRWAGEVAQSAKRSLCKPEFSARKLHLKSRVQGVLGVQVF